MLLFKNILSINESLSLTLTVNWIDCDSEPSICAKIVKYLIPTPKSAVFMIIEYCSNIISSIKTSEIPGPVIFTMAELIWVPDKVSLYVIVVFKVSFHVTSINVTLKLFKNKSSISVSLRVTSTLIETDWDI